MSTRAAVRRELRAAADASRAVLLQRFFKTGPGEYAEGDRFLGLTVPQVRSIATRHQSLSLPDLNALLALVILVRQYERATAAQRDAIYRLYRRNTARINNWDLVDCSAGSIVGAHLAARDRRVLERLARSPLVWERRIAIISTFFYIRRGELAPTLRIARLLLEDEHDLIHKAVGWMLREVGKQDRAVLRRFLRAHAHRMPRTMLRYAIERFPEGLRQRYLRARG